MAISALTACTVGPDFVPPQAALPSMWGPERTDVASGTVAAPVNPAWWHAFNDPELDALIGRLAESSLDLRIAAERIQQARAQRQVAAAAGLPRLDAQSFYKRERASPAGIISLSVPAPGAPLEFDEWQNGLSASWELDLFGRVRRSVEAQDAATLAAMWDRRGVALSALSELAQDYMQLRGAQAQLGIAESNLVNARRNADLVASQYGNGVATTLELAQARAQVAAIAATVAPLQTQQAALINAIGLLLAQPPRALEAELQPRTSVPLAPPRVPVGLPGDLVRRRPDVQVAEARLHEATAEIGVAVANFYPDVSLSGSFALNGLQFANAFNIQDRMFGVGPTIDIPIFRGGQLTGQLRLRKSQQREAAITFKQTVLRAWTEVDNALTAYANAQSSRQQAAEAERQNEAALSAARQRYAQGAADFLNVTSAEAQLLQSQNVLPNADTQIATNLVALYRALGGGWEATADGLAPNSR